MFLLKKKPNINSQRNVKLVYNKINFFIKKKINFFFIKKNKYKSYSLVNRKQLYIKTLIKQPRTSSLKSYFFIVVNIKKNIFSSFMGLIKNFQGSFFSINLVHGIFFSDPIIIMSLFLKFNFSIYLNTLTFAYLLYTHMFICSIELTKKKKLKKICQSSGSYAYVVALYKELTLCLLRLPSNKKILISFYFKCLLGRQSNVFSKYEKIGKAGFLSNYKKKPSVRGVAKNPIDHPHGGRTKSVQPEVSPWGWIAKKSH